MQQMQNQDPLQRANSFARRGKTFEADQKYIESLRRDPNNAEAHYHYGCHLFDTKRLADAKKEFDICLNLNPQHGKCHRKYSDMLGFMGKIQEAQRHFELAEQFDLRPDSPDKNFKSKWALNPQEK